MQAPAKKRAAAFWLLCGFLALALTFGLMAIPYIQHFGLSHRAVAGIYSCFLLSLILALTPGVSACRHSVRSVIWIFPWIWCLPYLLYAAGTGDFRWFAFLRLIGISLPIVLVYRFISNRNLARFGWPDLLVAIWLIAALLGHQLSGIWNIPANLDFMGRLFLIAVASGSWVFLRPVPELAYEFRLSWRVAREAAFSFLWFAVIAIPAGLALHFIQWNPLHRGVADFAVSFLEIFLFIALLEELFFRGFLQTLLSVNLGSKRNAQILVSCLFGLFHILHAPFPNWRYVLLATIAGWFYGQAFVKSGRLTASALTHAMVDTVWRTFFSKS